MMVFTVFVLNVKWNKVLVILSYPKCGSSPGTLQGVFPFMFKLSSIWFIQFRGRNFFKEGRM